VQKIGERGDSDGEQRRSDGPVGSVITQGAVAEGGGSVLSETNCKGHGGSD